MAATFDFRDEFGDSLSDVDGELQIEESIGSSGYEWHPSTNGHWTLSTADFAAYETLDVDARYIRLVYSPGGNDNSGTVFVAIQGSP